MKSITKKKSYFIGIRQCKKWKKRGSRIGLKDRKISFFMLVASLNGLYCTLHIYMFFKINQHHLWTHNSLYPMRDKPCILRNIYRGIVNIDHIFTFYSVNIFNIHMSPERDSNQRSRVMQLIKQALYPQATTAGSERYP